MGNPVQDAVRYWETHRVIYNVLLAAVVSAWVALTWPHFRGAMNWADFGRLLVLAFLANACYSLAYVVEVTLMGFSAAAARWLRSGVWVAGTVLAILFENYWIADEIYPFVR